MSAAPRSPLPRAIAARDRADVPAERVRSLILPRADRAQIVIVTFCFPVADRSTVSDEPPPTPEDSTRSSLARLRVLFPSLFTSLSLQSALVSFLHIGSRRPILTHRRHFTPSASLLPLQCRRYPFATLLPTLFALQLFGLCSVQRRQVNGIARAEVESAENSTIQTKNEVTTTHTLRMKVNLTQFFNLI